MNSNALDFVHDIRLDNQKILTVYLAIHCLKYFDVINYVTFRWMT